MEICITKLTIVCFELNQSVIKKIYNLYVKVDVCMHQYADV